MTNKEKLEAIKAYIKDCGKEAEGEIAYEYSKLMNFIDSLPDEPDWCHHRVDLSNCSEEYRKAYYDGWNNCNLQWQHWLDDNHINVGKRFDYQHATIVNKDFAENPLEAKPTHECNCRYVGCHVNGVRRWCHFIENEIPYDRCNPDCHSYQKFSVGDRIFESGKDTVSTIVGMERDKEGTGWYLFADGDKIRFDVAHQHYKLVVDVESEKVTFKRSTVTVEEPLPFEQENNNVFLYGLHGGQPQDEKKELGAITTVRGEDYVCVKDYKVGDCSYTKGKIYHSQRDGYLTDDNGISWSCHKSFYQEYLSDVNRHSS